MEKGALTGHRGVVQSAQFSPDGSHIVTASSARPNGQAMECRVRPRDCNPFQPRGQVQSTGADTASFNGDGTAIAVVSGEEAIRIIRTFQHCRNSPSSPGALCPANSRHVSADAFSCRSKAMSGNAQRNGSGCQQRFKASDARYLLRLISLTMRAGSPHP